MADREKFAKDLADAMVSDMSNPRIKDLILQAISSDPSGRSLGQMMIYDIRQGGRQFPRLGRFIQEAVRAGKVVGFEGLGQFDWGALVGGLISAGTQVATTMIKADMDRSLAKMQAATEQAKAAQQTAAAQAAAEAAKAQAEAARAQAVAAGQAPAEILSRPGQPVVTSSALPSWALPAAAVAAVALVVVPMLTGKGRSRSKRRR